MAASRNPTRITAEPDKQDLFITREFDAPRDLVFRAYTDPAVYVEWIGPRGYTTTIDVFEPVSGGKWRWIQADPEGHAFAFRGVYHEVTAPERIIGTFEFEGWPRSGHVVLEESRFEALPGDRCLVTTHSVYLSVADRDRMVDEGMEVGTREGYERLDDLLAGLRR